MTTLADVEATVRADRMERAARETAKEAAARTISAGDFMRKATGGTDPIWGIDSRALWVPGEPFVLAGAIGVGKTTLALEIALRRIGLRTAPLLGMPVKAGGLGRVLYVAADRPRQVARRLLSMVSDEERRILSGPESWIRFQSGPLPFDLAKEPQQLAKMAMELEAHTVVIDSLKDVALDLTRDDVGARVNFALQSCLAEDIEVVPLHHQRKAQVGNKTPSSIHDVYGSTWITAGAGSVAVLWGEPGATTLELRHLKQPAEEVGPWKVTLDKATGQLAVAGDAADEDDELAAAVLAAVEAHPGESLNTLRDVVRKRKEAVAAALEQLVEEGRVERFETRKNNKPFPAFRLAPSTGVTPGHSGPDGAGLVRPHGTTAPLRGAGDGAGPHPVGPVEPGPVQTNALSVGEWDE